MATINQINSILIIRNDSTTAWENSTYALKRGELALEYVYENGLPTAQVKLKAGAINGDKAWNDLPYISGTDTDNWRPIVISGTGACVVSASLSDSGTLTLNHGDLPLALFEKTEDESSGETVINAVAGVIKPSEQFQTNNNGEVVNISTDILFNGTEELVLFGGSA